MATLYDNHVSGQISDNPLSSGATTINSAAFANLSAVTNPDIMWIVLDPEAVDGAPEIVKVTAHTAAATSVTVTRAQQGTSARAHNQNTVWAHAVTAEDLDAFLVDVATADIQASAVTTAKIADLNVTTGKINDLAVTTGKLAADAVTGAQIADDQIDSEHYVDGSIDTAHIADAQITLAKMAANSVDSDQYVDGSIDTAHLADDSVTTAKLVPDAWTTATGTVKFGGSATNVTSETRWRRVFDTTIEFEAEFVLTGAPTSGTLTLDAPVAPADVGPNAGQVVGAAALLDSGTGRQTLPALYDPDTSLIVVNTNPGGFLGLASHASPWTWTSVDGGLITGRYKVAGA